MNSLVYVELKNIHLCPKFLVLYAKLYSIGKTKTIWHSFANPSDIWSHSNIASGI